MVSRPLVVAELERFAAWLQQPSVQSAISLAPSAAPTAAVGAQHPSPRHASRPSLTATARRGSRPGS